MKRSILTFAFLLAMQFGFSQADEAYKKEVLKLVEMSETATQIKLAKSQILSMIPEAKHAEFTKDFDATLPALYDKMTTSYMEVYSKEDIKAMIAFYESPVGKKITAKSGDLSAKTSEIGKEWGEGLQAMVMKYMGE